MRAAAARARVAAVRAWAAIGSALAVKEVVVTAAMAATVVAGLGSGCRWEATMAAARARAAAARATAAAAKVTAAAARARAAAARATAAAVRATEAA
eukprot:scaffold21670_cov27-Phaeocystis_antarctica.AAC.1